MMHAFIFAATAALGQGPVLDQQSFERWRDYIRPQVKDESTWKSPGVSRSLSRSTRQGRPIGPSCSGR